MVTAPVLVTQTPTRIVLPGRIGAIGGVAVNCNWETHPGLARTGEGTSQIKSARPRAAQRLKCPRISHEGLRCICISKTADSQAENSVHPVRLSDSGQRLSESQLMLAKPDCRWHNKRQPTNK